MAEAAFSENGKYYSAISQDGRLRIWDTETNILKQEYTPDLHLTSPPTCLQWITAALSVGPEQKNVKRKSSVSEQETQCIALGTASGKILIYSVALAKIETVLEKGGSAVKALDWCRGYGLYSCNKECTVYEWDLKSASVRNKFNIKVESKGKQANNVNAIKIVPNDQANPVRYLVAASWQVRVWRLVNGTATAVKCLGHNASPTAVLTLAYLNNAYWLIEGSQNERLLSFWDITISEDPPQMNGDSPTPTKKQRKKSLTESPTVPTTTVTTPTYSFVLEDAPRIVDVNLTDEDGAVRLSLAAATRSGVVHYYAHMLNGSSSKPIKPSVTVQVTTAEAHPLPLQCCRLPRTAAGELLLGYSSGPTMIFEKVAPDLKTKTQVLIRGDGKQSKKIKQQKLANEVNKIHPGQNDTEVTYVEPMGGVSRKRVTPGGQIEVPMEARLANLALDVKSRSKSAVNQNLTKLLMQGLHSKDKSIIQMVLQKNETGVAQRTVGSLPADYVSLLLEELADMASKKTKHCASVCTWLSAVLRSHSALLLATITSKPTDQLTHLLAIFTQRRSHLCQLMNLKGRLDLTIKQRSAAGESQENQQAVLEYKDTSSDEEMEVEQYQSDSEQSWGDDKFGSEASANEQDGDSEEE